MTSYFEISGHIVECSTDGNTSHPSSLSMVTAAERPERGRDSAKAEWGETPETAADLAVVTDSEGKDLARMFGGASIRAGIAILWVPDPIPFVDEVVGAALIGAGSGLIMYSES
jgi:hypothetical protein